MPSMLHSTPVTAAYLHDSFKTYSSSPDKPAPRIEDLISPAAWSLIQPHFSEYARETLERLISFVYTDCIPSEETYDAQVNGIKGKASQGRWCTIPDVMGQLKRRAKEKGLWNLFLSRKAGYKEGVDLTNLEYAVIAEVMGRSILIAPQATNCSAPDTGNMELLARYANDEQKARYLGPLLAGEIRSAFAMTERGVASSDARNITTSIRQEGNEIVISGRKWWISGAGDPRCTFHLVMGVSDPWNVDPYKRQSIVLVPTDASRLTIVRPMSVMGYDDAPEGHCEVVYDNVRVPVANLIGGWGRGFEIVQGRLGPGRLHHCMRSIGMAERALDLMVDRVNDPRRTTFGKMLVEHGTVLQGIARSRAEIDQARLLVLAAAHRVDTVGAKAAMKAIGLAKLTVPKVALTVVDRAIQAFGAEGLSQDQPLAYMWVSLRTLRLADGPDEVHEAQVGRMESRRGRNGASERAAKL